VNIQGTISEHPENIQGTIRKHSVPNALVRVSAATSPLFFLNMRLKIVGGQSGRASFIISEKSEKWSSQ
jgi:hypothetical protein